MQQNVLIITGKLHKTTIKKPGLGCHYFYHTVQNQLECNAYVSINPLNAELNLI